MRLLYLCVLGGPRTKEFDNVKKFIDNLPRYLQYHTNQNKTENQLFFADRLGKFVGAEVYDACIVFISPLFLDSLEALECLKSILEKISNIVFIDIHDNLSDEQCQKILEISPCKIFSTEEGRAYLINTFQDPEEIENQRFVIELNKSIENEGFQYLDNTINKLNGSAFRNRVVSIACYSGSFLILISFLVLVIVKANDKVLSNDLYFLIWKGIEIVTESALAISASRFLFILGKSFMVEAIRASDRAHAIGLGKLYLQLFKNKFDWNELKDVLQNWNIDKGSAFITQDAKDIEGGKIEEMITKLKK